MPDLTIKDESTSGRPSNRRSASSSSPTGEPAADSTGSTSQTQEHQREPEPAISIQWNGVTGSNHIDEDRPVQETGNGINGTLRARDRSSSGLYSGANSLGKPEDMERRQDPAGSSSVGIDVNGAEGTDNPEDETPNTSPAQSTHGEFTASMMHDEMTEEKLRELGLVSR